MVCFVGALDRHADVLGLGLAQLGELGAELLQVEPPDAPVQVAGTWSAVTAGRDHTCGLDTDGTPWCWGATVKYQLARLPTDDLYQELPERIDTSTWTSIDAGVTRTCGTRAQYELLECPAN